MASNEEKAKNLVIEAEKKLAASKSFFGSLFGGATKVEDALENYQRAANLYKMSKKWAEAGNAFCYAADLHAKAGSRHDAATNYVDAANCYRKCDINEAVQCLLKAIEIYTDMGRFTMAAKHHQTIAEMYETDAVDLERAIQHYEVASDYFRGEESNSSANKCLLKVAQYSAQLEEYDKAILMYEKVAESSLESSLLKYSAKEYLFRAAVCHMVVDILNAQLALVRYVTMCPAFQDSREYKLLQNLIEHMEENNSTEFANVIKDYHSISALDQWYTTMFLRVKKQLSDTPDLR